MIRVLFLSALFAFPVCVLAKESKYLKVDADGWHFIKEVDGVAAFKRRLEGEKLYQFKSIGVIEAPIDKVLSVVIDARQAKEWIPKLLECEIKDYSNYPDSFVQYSKYDVPWPMKDRIFLSTVSIHVDPDTHKTDIVYSNIDTDMAYDEKKIVQGYIGGSTYTLRPTHDGMTHFTAISVVDPRGGVPDWLVNWVGESMPFDTMKRLRNRLNSVEPVIDQQLASLYQQPVSEANVQ